MIGAIIGDIVGSSFAFDENNIKTKAAAIKRALHILLNAAAK